MSYGYTEDCSAGRQAQEEARSLYYELNDLRQHISAVQRDVNDENAWRRACNEEIWEAIHDLRSAINELAGELRAGRVVSQAEERTEEKVIDMKGRRDG